MRSFPAIDVYLWTSLLGQQEERCYGNTCPHVNGQQAEMTSDEQAIQHLAAAEL